jgi:hypothetical protein
MSFDWRKYLTFAELMYKKANSDDSDCHDKETFIDARSVEPITLCFVLHVII